MVLGMVFLQDAHKVDSESLRLVTKVQMRQVTMYLCRFINH